MSFADSDIENNISFEKIDKDFSEELGESKKIVEIFLFIFFIVNIS